jgi:peptidoglycan/LPS O-acetylase OafA/YrhL
MTLTSALLVGGLYHGQPGSLSRLLSSGPAQLFGKVSYSLYLLNVIFLYMVWAFTDQLHWMKGHEIEVGLLVGLCVLTFSLPLSYVMQRWVEEPGIAVGRKLNGTLARWGAKRHKELHSLGQLATVTSLEAEGASASTQ